MVVDQRLAAGLDDYWLRSGGCSPRDVDQRGDAGAAVNSPCGRTKRDTRSKTDLSGAVPMSGDADELNGDRIRAPAQGGRADAGNKSRLRSGRTGQSQGKCQCNDTLPNQGISSRPNQSVTEDTVMRSTI
jgi:hypothetical protein